jgi:hypothetical protein
MNNNQVSSKTIISNLQSNSIKDDELEESKTLIKEIRDLLLKNLNSATTELIVNHFKSKSENKTILFKKLLKKIATFDKISSIWVLKDKYI